jgi:hypothetical protein
MARNRNSWIFDANFDVAFAFKQRLELRSKIIELLRCSDDDFVQCDQLALAPE